MSSPLPINSAARNAVWSYPATAEPRFPGAPAIIETRRSHEPPDLFSLPEGADVAIELYGGALSLWLDGARHRLYIRRFEFVSFGTDEDARYAFSKLWREVEHLESAAEVERAAESWLEEWKRKRSLTSSSREG
jgi:hypothetical protein